MELVIVGGSFAGITAAVAARKKFPTATITILEKNETIGFIPGALHLVLNGEVENLAHAYFISVEEVEQLGIKVLLGAEVEQLETRYHQINYHHHSQNKQITYDKLILATGSIQDSKKIKGMTTERIIKYKTVEQAQKSLEIIRANRILTIVGGGQVGIEMADCLIRQDKQVVLIESMGSILGKYFDPEMLLPVIKQMEKQGVQIYCNETVEEIVENPKGLILKTQCRMLQSEGAVFALSVKPHLPYLDKQIRTHTDGTVFVDEYLKTSVEDVFAVGDCIQSPSSLSDESFYVSLTNNAIRGALVAVENLLEPTKKFVGTARTIGTKVFGYYIASTGLTEKESIFFDEEIGVTHVSQPATVLNPRETINGKLIYNIKTGRVLGAQLISKANILEKINTLSLGIQMKITVDELAQKDYFFQPVWSSIYEITNQLGVMKE